MKFDRKNNDGGKRNTGRKFQRGGNGGGGNTGGGKGKKFPPGKQGGRRGVGSGGGEAAPQGRRGDGGAAAQGRRGVEDAGQKMRRESIEAENIGKSGGVGKADGFGNGGDGGEASHFSRAARPQVDIPEGTPVVQLRSASYGAFIYQRMIGHVDGKVRDGDMVAVTDKHGEFFGWGFYNSRSQIGLRMFSHSGKAPNEREIARRIKVAVDFRRSV
ncbi:MAG: hypothetical protein EHM48_00280, partial [Planctomycetaceae bacterium]